MAFFDVCAIQNRRARATNLYPGMNLRGQAREYKHSDAVCALAQCDTGLKQMWQYFFKIEAF